MQSPAQFIARLKERVIAGRARVYEFDKYAAKWFPSYGGLHRGRIITDNVAPNAFEQPPGVKFWLESTGFPR